MIDNLRGLAMPATIATCFFLFGFFSTAGMLGLTAREIAIGLVSGAIGGLTTLAAVLHQWSRDIPASAE